MKKNIGIADKWVRILIAAIILVLYGFDIIPSSTLVMILLIVGIVLLLTSLLGFCPLYTLFGINTNKKK